MSRLDTLYKKFKEYEKDRSPKDGYLVLCLGADGTGFVEEVRLIPRNTEDPDAMFSVVRDMKVKFNGHADGVRKLGEK